jgi:hypothetical protein
MFLLLVGCSGYLSPGDKKFCSSRKSLLQSLGPLNQSSLCTLLLQCILRLLVLVLDLSICMSVYYLKVTQFKFWYLGSQFFQTNPIKMTVIIFLLSDFRNTLLTFGLKTNIQHLTIQPIHKTMNCTIEWFKYWYISLLQIALFPKFLSIKIALFQYVSFVYFYQCRSTLNL